METIGVSVFGTPITQGTRTERAQAAAKNKNADGKFDQALQFSVNNLKAAARGVNVDTSNITEGYVYNATGDPMTYVTAHDWEGHVAGQTPKIIQNGEWANFYHIGEPRHPASIGAYVFNIQNYTDSMVAWNNPKKAGCNGINTAYCEMKDPGYFNYQDWNGILHNLRDSGAEYKTSMEGFTTKVSIDGAGIFKAEFYMNAA